MIAKRSREINTLCGNDTSLCLVKGENAELKSQDVLN